MILLYRGLGKEKIIIMEQDLIKPGQSGQDRDLFLLLNKQKAMFLAWPFVVGFTLANQKNKLLYRCTSYVGQSYDTALVNEEDTRTCCATYRRAR